MSVSSQQGQCFRCGTIYPLGTIHHCAIDPIWYYPAQPAPVTIPQGWQCPICGSVYAPSVQMCFGNHSQLTTTTNTIPSADDQRPASPVGGEQ